MIDRHAAYRAEIRRTLQKFSDEGLAFQDRRIIGGIDREECDREIRRRENARREDAIVCGPRQ
jgi:hypothetical protein